MFLKNTILVILIFFFTTDCFSQAADTIVISKIVEQQIAAAREKERRTSEYYASKEEFSAVNNNSSSTPKTVKAEEETLGQKAMIIGSAAFAIGGIVVYRRVRSKMGNKNSKDLKTNINRLRQEELLFAEDPKLKLVREKLNGYNYYDMNEEKISQKAKEYKISQGEMMLAARLKSNKRVGV